MVGIELRRELRATTLVSLAIVSGADAIVAGRVVSAASTGTRKDAAIVQLSDTFMRRITNPSGVRS